MSGKTEVPEEAVEAAAKAFLLEIIMRKGEIGASSMALLSALEAAAPFIAAKALEDAADMIGVLPFASNAGAAFAKQHIAKQVRARAHAAVRGEG